METDQPVNRDEQLNKFWGTYGYLRHKASTTFGEKGYEIKKERDSVYHEIISLEAQSIVDSPVSQRRESLDSSLSRLNSSITGPTPRGEIEEFLKDIVLKVIDLSTPVTSE